MKIIGFLFALCLTFFAKSQISYDFANTLPPEGEKNTAVLKTFFGTYSSDQTDIDYQFNKEGVFAISFIYNSISRETIRESSIYSVKDGYLFGVKGIDSVPCELQGEFYHFAIMFKEQIVGGTATNVLSKLNQSTYILNFEDNGHYTPSYLTFKGSELAIQHFTYEESTTIFDAIAEKTEISTSEMKYITLDPTKEEWLGMQLNDIISAKLLFEKR
jgi:hypothetical protein